MSMHVQTTIVCVVPTTHVCADTYHPPPELGGGNPVDMANVNVITAYKYSQL